MQRLQFKDKNRLFKSYEWQGLLQKVQKQVIKTNKKEIVLDFNMLNLVFKYPIADNIKTKHELLPL